MGRHIHAERIPPVCPPQWQINRKQRGLRSSSPEPSLLFARQTAGETGRRQDQIVTRNGPASLLNQHHEQALRHNQEHEEENEEGIETGVEENTESSSDENEF